MLTAAPFPRVSSAEEYEDALGARLWLFARWRGAESPDAMRGLVGARAEALGLGSHSLEAVLREGLRQIGALGCDEMSEYHRNTARLFGGSVADASVDAIVYGLEELGATLVTEMSRLRAAAENVVFLGTDAEYQMLTWDALFGGTCPSTHFHMSRTVLMHPLEMDALWSAREAVLGPGGTSRAAADGAPLGRDYGWTDNALVSVVMHQMLQRARKVHILAQLMAEELLEQPIQRGMLASGRTTFFGAPDPRVDRAIRAGIRDNRFARVLLPILARFHDCVLEHLPRATVVDLGASGTQPLLLTAAARTWVGLSAHERHRLVAACDLPARQRHALDRLHARAPTPTVALFCPRPFDRCESDVRTHPASWRFALAVESMKSVQTVHGEKPVTRVVRNVSPAQEVLAYLKQLIVHQVARKSR